MDLQKILKYENAFRKVFRKILQSALNATWRDMRQEPRSLCERFRGRLCKTLREQLCETKKN